MGRRLKYGVQLELPSRSRGGRRKGAGRPRTVGIVLHRTRPELSKRHPVHITLRLQDDLPSIRKEQIFAGIKRSFLNGHNRFGMRLVHFSVLSNHIHLIVEADDKKALTRGLQGITIRLARSINRILGRRGKVFAERYHARILKTPTEVRNAVQYVLQNFRKHCERGGRTLHAFYIDPFSSMSGEACSYMLDYDHFLPVVAEPETWMLRFVEGRASPSSGAAPTGFLLGWIRGAPRAT